MQFLVSVPITFSLSSGAGDASQCARPRGVSEEAADPGGLGPVPQQRREDRPHHAHHHPGEHLVRGPQQALLQALESILRAVERNKKGLKKLIYNFSGESPPTSGSGIPDLEFQTRIFVDGHFGEVNTK
mgnify:CR=1 FL=1